jgi:uncharacterized protein
MIALMTFEPGVKLDPSQVEDMRGSGGRGRGVVVGGGGIGLVLALLYVILGGSPSDIGGAGGPAAGGSAPGDSVLKAECKTGADANATEECRIVGYVDSIQAYWQGAFQAAGRSYEPATTRFFTGQLDTGCGPATTEVGPFYCPQDGHVYIDLGFFDELRSRFGATGGPLAEAYVIAHEYGHHVQDLEGTLTEQSGAQGATGSSVRTELQADCFAGIWVDHAAATGYLKAPTAAQIADALDAAAAVGDDRIQAAQGRVTPETWTHGSSAQRKTWFTNGLRDGTESSCDTFGGSI